jgi:hypothetical protein
VVDDDSNEASTRITVSLVVWKQITTIQRTGRNTDLGIILITRTLQELVKAGTLPDGMCNLQSVHY